jgi:hypothetical protein
VTADRVPCPQCNSQGMRTDPNGARWKCFYCHGQRTVTPEQAVVWRSPRAADPDDPELGVRASLAAQDRRYRR